MTAVGIAAGVEADLEMDPAGAALLLVELYQEEGLVQEAADLLESLGGEGVEPNLAALSLAELYTGLEQWDEVVRVTDGAESEDDVTTAVLVYRASALREVGMLDAALDVHKASLRSRKRDKGVLNFAYYERSKTYEARGNARMARKDLETICAVDPSFADVKSRLTDPEA